MHMQRKHLIAFTLATIVMLLGFNFINGDRHEQNRAALVDSDAPVVAEVDTASNSDSMVNNVNGESNTINKQPLGEQPKAIIDNATTQIEQAQQVDQQRLEQMDNTQ